MRLAFKMPPTCKQEKEYIVSVLIGEFLGIDYDLLFEDIQEVVITNHQDNKQLILPDTFFSLADENWLSNRCIPAMSLNSIDITNVLGKRKRVEDRVPVIFGGKNQKEIEINGHAKIQRIDIDIFGSCFFMLSRFEEAVLQEMDQHDRFSAKSSLAYREGFLERPIVNEYLEILWSCISKIWPGLGRKHRQFRIYPTHDVDRPYLYRYKSLVELSINTTRDIARRRPGRAMRRVMDWVAVKTGNLNRDPFNTFESIMDMSERQGLKSTFYFLTNSGYSRYDGKYTLGERVITGLLSSIHNRGHLIGLHGSYSSFDNEEKLRTEKQELLYACDQCEIELDLLRSRQHYLRWHTPVTSRLLNDMGVQVDSTLGYADHAGFRCGTCYDYPLYDVVRRERLALREQPMILMECTVLDDHYMGYGASEQALDYMLLLKDRCRKYHGDFVYLWHNSRYSDPAELGIVETLING